MGSLPKPASALIQGAIGAYDEALTAPGIFQLFKRGFESGSTGEVYLYPMSSQPLSSWWKRCMERMSAAHCLKVRQGWLGWKVWWIYRWKRGRERFVGVPLYGFASHMQRGIIGGQSKKKIVGREKLL